MNASAPTRSLLRSLSIRNIVLIESLDLQFEQGLCALTGETGAGKSILLDSLGLALGNRSEARLVRHGADKGQVIASFDIGASPALRRLLDEQEIEADDELVLRRSLGKDGRSRAFLNDQPVSVSLLKQIGAELVEIHGQNDQQGLLDPEHHLDLLDRFAVNEKERRDTRDAWKALRKCQKELKEAKELLARAAEDEEFARHALAELESLAPVHGEEEELSAERTLLMQDEKVASSMKEAVDILTHDGGIDGRLRNAERAVERANEKTDGRFDDLLDVLAKAAHELAIASDEVERSYRDLDLDPARLEQVEERLFALRALARKHNCNVDALPDLQQKFAFQLASVEKGTSRIQELEQTLQVARDHYLDAANRLTDSRRIAAEKLDSAIMAELPDLKLGNARFFTDIQTGELDAAQQSGLDQVQFLVATNPGTPPGPIHKIASGGELSRFMLAIKVVLADGAGSLVFDEIDAGIGGATAAAVGERLGRLADGNQVLVVTHSPQVAARARRHMQIAKAANEDSTVTDVTLLDHEARREEVARMLAGAEITDEARAAADRLLAPAS